MSAQRDETVIWETWDAHRNGCADCAKASRPPAGVSVDPTALCLHGGVLFTKWQNALEIAQHMDEAEHDRDT